MSRFGASALGFFFSFALNSLMVLYVFVMFGLFVAVWRANGEEQGSLRRLVLSAWRCASGYPELVVLPLVYWGVLNVWFKRVGDYADYYGIRLPTFSALRDGWRSFFRIGYSRCLRQGGPDGDGLSVSVRRYLRAARRDHRCARSRQRAASPTGCRESRRRFACACCCLSRWRCHI